MFSVGDLIVYSETGVCRVEQIGPPPFDPKAKREYYTLSPMNCRETIYVPVDTQVFMRPILSREAAEELAEKTRSQVVQVIGTKFVLYRPTHKKDKKDKIVLVSDRKRKG